MERRAVLLTQYLSMRHLGIYYNVRIAFLSTIRATTHEQSARLYFWLICASLHIFTSCSAVPSKGGGDSQGGFSSRDVLCVKSD